MENRNTDLQAEYYLNVEMYYTEMGSRCKVLCFVVLQTLDLGYCLSSFCCFQAPSRCPFLPVHQPLHLPWSPMAPGPSWTFQSFLHSAAQLPCYYSTWSQDVLKPVSVCLCVCLPCF